MSQQDYESVLNDMRLADGTLWPMPITLDVDAETAGAHNAGDKIALRDRTGLLVAVITVSDIWQPNKADEAEKAFGTTDKAHPAVAYLYDQAGDHYIGGSLEGISMPIHYDFLDLRKTPVQLRAEFESKGADRVVAFQTRNPMHRAPEELCRMAMESVGADGLVIHMLLGKLKPGDIPADVRDASIRKMVENYFPPHSALITGYGFDMLYAGPREALLHAVFRQNMGATHFIVGRDHAGVGDYYGPFDAQEIFEQIPKDALKIEIFMADHTAYSKKLGKVVMMREAPDHTTEDFVLLSGTAVREMLGNGIAPPSEFARPEVAQILMDYYVEQS